MKYEIKVDLPGKPSFTLGEFEGPMASALREGRKHPVIIALKAYLVEVPVSVKVAGPVLIESKTQLRKAIRAMRAKAFSSGDSISIRNATNTRKISFTFSSDGSIEIAIAHWGDDETYLRVQRLTAAGLIRLIRWVHPCSQMGLSDAEIQVEQL